MIAPALRLVAATRGGAVLAHRPGSTVVHLYRGPLTPSGRWVPRTGRAVCRAHTRRLSVIEPGAFLGLDRVLVDGRRVCRRCMALTPVALGVSNARDVTAREDLAHAYAALTPADVALAGRWARSTGESHQIGRVALILFGPRPMAPVSRRTAAQAELVAMHEAINDRRHQLVAAERTPEERAELEARREAEAHDRERIRVARSKQAYVDKLAGIAGRGGFLTRPERERLRSA